MNESIQAAAYPATEIPMSVFTTAATEIHRQMRAMNYAHYNFEPGDGTRYEIVIIPTLLPTGSPYRFASNFAPAYSWNGTPSVHPDYAKEHYVSDGNMWSAVVFALLLNSLAELMATRRRVMGVN